MQREKMCLIFAHHGDPVVRRRQVALRRTRNDDPSCNVAPESVYLPEWRAQLSYRATLVPMYCPRRPSESKRVRALLAKYDLPYVSVSLLEPIDYTYMQMVDPSRTMVSPKSSRRIK